MNPLPPTAHEQQYLTFLLGQEMFALGISAIKEIIEYSAPTPVPMMPGVLRGVINLRGAVVPVLDLQARFGRTPSPVERRSCIVIVEMAVGEGRQVMGVVVDAVSEVLDIAAGDIEPPPQFGAQLRTDFIRGMARVRDRFVIVLDLNSVLSMDELETLASQAQASASHGSLQHV
ncbi:chemotaxis protein CheW [Amphibiibacter pelophylacis]|uniref:Chemotaxis protein CheW n=1 Tax=Amphibiibacter pelophylacis TaxID=1799477 RepID=A0ACC6P3K5_9BURK